MKKTSTRRDFLKTATLATGSAALARGAGAAASPVSGRKPNILFILTDQWRGSATGYAGDPNARTPNLDRLAAEALDFCNTVSVCPVCTPYRAALMTGRFPTSTGMFLNDAYLPEEELCLAEILHDAGYATGYIGKWHLDGHGRQAFIPRARRQGWDYWKVAECDHNYNRSHYYGNDDPEKRFWEGYDAYAQTKDAQQYLKQRLSAAQPFTLLLSYGTPHFPHHTAPDELKALYPPEKIQLPPNVPAGMRKDSCDEAQGYYAHCTALDRCVGDLLQTLQETGLDQNTIVVFTSDHGESLGSHGCIPCKKHLPFDETARVPFLIRLPERLNQPGRRVRMPLTTPDITATLLGLAGVPVPASIEGENLAAAVRHPDAAPPRAALYGAVAPFGTFGPNTKELRREYRAIRTERYTFARDLNGGWLLYDDRNDPFQLENLAGRPEHAALQQELDAKLQAELDRIGDPFRDGQHHIDGWGYHVKNGQSVPYKAGSPVQSPKRIQTGKAA